MPSFYLRRKWGWNFTLGWKANLLAAIMYKMWREAPKQEIKDLREHLMVKSENEADLLSVEEN